MSNGNLSQVSKPPRISDEIKKNLTVGTDQARVSTWDHAAGLSGESALGHPVHVSETATEVAQQ